MDDSMFIVTLILCFAGMCRCIWGAQQKGRSALRWGLFGFISPVIAMILISAVRSLVVVPEDYDAYR